MNETQQDLFMKYLVSSFCLYLIKNPAVFSKPSCPFQFLCLALSWLLLLVGRGSCQIHLTAEDFERAKTFNDAARNAEVEFGIGPMPSTGPEQVQFQASKGVGCRDDTLSSGFVKT